MKSDIYKVTVIIPHYNGEDILRRCLLSLGQTTFKAFSVLLVDNGSSDGSVQMVRQEFPHVRVLQSDTNLGFAGGSNFGIKHSESPYIVLLNNDTQVTPGWLTPMIAMMESDPKVAAIQPKIRSIKNKQRFDYCGAAGGEMDYFGYPFARGRLFHIMEEDTGQYDHGMHDIFWASGAAIMLKRMALDHVGCFEESFFAHMEEIDLCWRLLLAGYRVCAVPDAVVFHQTGGTLGQEKLTKMILNHRNSLLTVLRNYSPTTLLWLFPLRLILEVFTLCSGFATGQWKRALAVPAGLWGVMIRFKTVLEGSRHIQKIRRVSDQCLMKRMYHGSVALAFFLGGKKRFSDLGMS